VARQRFDPEQQSLWGWWWTPDLAHDMGLEDNQWPTWTDDEPWDLSMVQAWYRDQDLPEPRPPKPAVEVVPEVKRAPAGARVNGERATETRDAGRRARRMKRYMVWWRARRDARLAGLPDPPRPEGGFGDERDDDPVH
jgi:hypothetical protein